MNLALRFCAAKGVHMSPASAINNIYEGVLSGAHEAKKGAHLLGETLLRAGEYAICLTPLVPAFLLDRIEKVEKNDAAGLTVLSGIVELGAAPTISGYVSTDFLNYAVLTYLLLEGSGRSYAGLEGKHLGFLPLEGSILVAKKLTSYLRGRGVKKDFEENID